MANSPCPRCGQPAAGRFCANCGSPLGAGSCPACQAELRPGVRFCHRCGTPLGRKPARPARSAGGQTAWIAASAVGVVLIAAAALLATRSGATAPPPARPAVASGTPPGLSQMTPREQADRLFDRIMQAAERGDEAEVAQFQPMALAAYANLGGLDADARYHVGLIHTLTGNPGAAAAQLDSLRAAAGEHLLATMLEFSLAQTAGDESGQSQAYRRFLDAYDAEWATGREEYLAHKPAIDAFRNAANRAVGGGN